MIVLLTQNSVVDIKSQCSVQLITKIHQMVGEKEKEKTIGYKLGSRKLCHGEKRR